MGSIPTSSTLIENKNKKPKIIVIVGQTASGKTSLSIKLAREFDGEIISADSRQVYRGMDLGTGKVTKNEMEGVPHHLLDVADPNTIYTASDFRRDASHAISDILERKKLPIVCGGTFFYVDVLLGRIGAPEVEPNEELRAELEKLSTDALYTVLLREDPRRAEDIDPHNKRRIIRALEIVEAVGSVPLKNEDLKYNPLIIGIDIEKEELHKNIHDRLLERIDEGMIEEVKKLIEGRVSHERMEELGLEYRYISRYLRGEIDKDTMTEELEKKIVQYAKRQMTWLKRDKTIHWFKKDDLTKIKSSVEKFLNH